MKSFNFVYDDFLSFKNFVETNKIKDSENTLIQIFTSEFLEKDKILKLIKDISSLFPSSQIIGATTDGEIVNENVTVNETVISITEFEKTILKVAAVENQDSRKMGIEITKLLDDENAKVIITFTDGLNINGEEYLKGIEEVNKKIIVAGGMAGDRANFKKTYVFTKDKIISNGAVGVALINKNLKVFNDYEFNWIKLGKGMKVTKSEKNRVYLIDNMPAYDIYKKYLGEDIAKKLPAIGIEFPLIIEKEKESVARAVLAVHKDGSLSFAGNVNEGEIVYLGYGDGISIINESLKLKGKLAKYPIESVFIYSCMARRRFLSDLIEKEIKPLNDIASTAGFFTYGEFFSAKHKELLNETMTIIALSETDKVKKINLKKEKIKTDEHYESLKAILHLLSITVNELNKENEILQAKEESLKLAQDVGHFGSMEFNFYTHKIECSDKAYEIFKVKERAPTIKKFLKRIVDKEKFKNSFRKLKSGDIVTVELKMLRDDGKIINVLLNCKMIYENSKLLKVVVTILDITEIYNLREKNLIQSQILEQINDGVVLLDLEGNIQYWNKGAELLFRYSKEEILGKNADMFFMKDYHINIKNIISLVLKKGFYKKDFLIKIPKLKKEMYVDANFSVLKNHKNEIVGIICFTRDVTQKKIAKNKIKEQSKLLSYQATHDALTSLTNRMFFEMKLEEILKNIDNENMCALLFIDLDNFKEINDTLGHNIGDEVLKEVAKRVSFCIRKDDVFSRLGGDEFTIILRNIQKYENVKVVLKKIFNVLNKKIQINNHEIFPSASIGVALCPKDSTDKDEVIKFADAAMYKAKETGKNRYVFYSPEITKETLKKVSIQHSIRKALENDEFVAYYQPQVDGKDNSIIGMEALVRWMSPEKGLVPPGKFIPVAEKSDLIVEIDNVVMEKAMRDFSRWYKKGLNPGTLSLNLSVKQLDFDNLIDTILKTAKKTDFNLEWLELEVTESLMMNNMELVIKKLNIIHNLGIKIAIDDFGTGYSSLSYLKRLPVDKLKIDKSFVDNLPEDEEDIAISKAIIALSNSLNLKTIAEGVETKAQLDFLVENGCNYIQGYYYSPPVPKEEMEKFLIKKSF